MAQIDQERDTRPAWLRGCSIDVKDITSQTLQGSEPTQPKMGKEVNFGSFYLGIYACAISVQAR